MTTSDNSISPEDRRRFGRTLARAMEQNGISQTQLGPLVGASQSVVSNWTKGRYAAPPRTVFLLEELLGMAPGRLSSIYGYYPLSAFQRTDLDSAVIDAEEFDDTEKAAIQAVIEALRAVRARHAAPVAEPVVEAESTPPRAGRAAARAKAAGPAKKAPAKRSTKLSSVGPEVT